MKILVLALLAAIVISVWIGTMYVLRELFSRPRPYYFDESQTSWPERDQVIRLERESERRMRRILNEIDLWKAKE